MSARLSFARNFGELIAVYHELVSLAWKLYRVQQAGLLPHSPCPSVDHAKLAAHPSSPDCAHRSQPHIARHLVRSPPAPRSYPKATTRMSARYNGQRRRDVPDLASGNLFIDVGDRAPRRKRHSFHHELFHLIDYRLRGPSRCLASHGGGRRKTARAKASLRPSSLTCE